MSVTLAGNGNGARVEKGLIVVHRQESAEDFKQIAKRMHKLDRSVAVAMVSEYLDSRILPPAFLDLPLLVIYLVNPPPTEFKKARKLAVRYVDKIDEYQGFLAAGIPCLPLEKFEFGMELDPAIYGEWVVLKPRNMSSTGHDVNMVPTAMLPRLRVEDFPADHLIHKDEYLVQKYLHTGARPTHYRVCLLLGEVIYSRRNIAKQPLPDKMDDVRALLSLSIATNNRAARDVEMYRDERVNAFARQVFDAHPDLPLQGIDILREEGTGKLYALEANLGGNVWHFSSVRGAGTRFDVGGKGVMVKQYGAWDAAARALLRATRAMAR